MYEKQAAMFLYCTSPVHMGAGTAIGVIDNPIQRERHTGHPMGAGSGLKGALRDHAAGNGWDDAVRRRIFGAMPDEDADQAGAISFGDAQIVLFPVRSLRRSFVYATCPTALARLQRLLAAAGIDPVEKKPNKPDAKWNIPAAEGNGCVVLDEKLAPGGQLILEAFEFAAATRAPGAAEPSSVQDLRRVANWLAENALPAGDAHSYFRQKILLDTVLLSDERFGYFVRNSTVVEPHVRINDASGTADDGGLFYTENLPPESLLVSLAMASKSWKPKDGEDQRMEADGVLQRVVGHFRGRTVQVGGDATTGRGQVVLSFAQAPAVAAPPAKGAAK